MNVPMELSRIMITELGEQQVIFLKERDGERSFPIMIGTHEALAIDRRLKDQPTPRPMTHELLANVIEALGATIDSIVINDLCDHAFIASLFLSRDGETIEIDCRPSDAIALGVAFNTQIFVAEHVLDTVFNETSTKEDRLEMLRSRLEMLGRRIAEFSERLADEAFLAQAPQEVIEGARHQLDEMKAEHTAIDRVLKKLG